MNGRATRERSPPAQADAPTAPAAGVPPSPDAAASGRRPRKSCHITRGTRSFHHHVFVACGRVEATRFSFPIFAYGENWERKRDNVPLCRRRKGKVTRRPRTSHYMTQGTWCYAQIAFSPATAFERVTVSGGVVRRGVALPGVSSSHFGGEAAKMGRNNGCAGAAGPRAPASVGTT
mgnify:CR=1 FL=1